MQFKSLLMKSKLLFGILALVLLYSCKKSEKRPLTEKEKLLTAHGWINTLITINGIEWNLTLCNKDDYWIFKPDGSLTIYTGTKKCYSNEVNHTGSWQLSIDEKHFTYSYDNIDVTTDFEVTSDQLVFSYTYLDELRVYTYKTYP